jgi:hypothetical protein
MRSMKFLAALGMGAFLCLISYQVSARTFTDVQGRKIEATVIQVNDGKVELKMDKNGKSYHVPLAKLCRNDITFLENWGGAEKKNNLAEGAKSSASKRIAGKGTAEALKKQYNLKDNFTAPWPDRINSGFDVDIKIVKEDADNHQFIYHSPNYEFVSDVRLSKNVVNKFSALFEATREYCRLLPISTIKAHVPGEKFRNRILLFETKEAYLAHGGPPGSAGVFMRRGEKAYIMVPLSSLGVKKVGSGYMYNYKGSNKVLPHELTHQLTDLEYFTVGARGWFSEGFAEYVAVTPYRSGKFMVRSNLSSIKKYVTAHGKDGTGGRALGESILAPDLKAYMLMPYKEFTGSNGNKNYGLGLLLTYYYFHWDNDGDRKNLNAFFIALKEGKSGEDALNILLNGRSWDEMDSASSTCSICGVTIFFLAASIWVV